MKQQTRKPRGLFKASLISGMLLSCLLLPFSFGFIMQWFGVDYWTALVAAGIVAAGGLVTAALIPGIGEAEAAALFTIYETYGWDGLIEF